MEISLDKIWENSLNLIKEEISLMSYKTWINPLKPISIDENTITFYAPSEIQKEQVEQKFIALIKSAISIVTNKEYEVSITLEEEPVSLNTETFKNENKTETHSTPILNQKYTFDSFVIGKGNMLAHAAAVAVADTPNGPNPLFLYGDVGLGKTHLMNAIGNHILSKNKNAKILFVSSEKFTNDLVNAIRDNKNEEFRQKYRSVDVLLVDDIQFIGGKERTEEEFFHTFNALYELNKKIIISSDKPPKDLLILEKRLRSRFGSGIIADIQAPDIETRIAILKKKASTESLIVPDDVIYFIAEKITTNIRELEGALNRVIAYSSITNSPLTLDFAQEALKEIIAASQNKIITINLIQENVARYYDITIEDLKSSKRNKEYVFPRHIAMYLSRELTDFSLPKIGKEFGGRDHTTVMNACDKIEYEIKKDGETRRTIEELTRSITGK